jgi:hypothetical protein
MKLIYDFPLLSLHFIRTSDNLADYLSRQGMPKGDLQRLSLKNIKIEDFYDMLPKRDFTLAEWDAFCQNNPEYLTVNDGPTVLQISKALSAGIDNIRDVVTPLEILKAKFSRDIIIAEQKKQFSKIYIKCLGSKDFIYTYNDAKGKVQTYALVLDLLMYEHNGLKIYVPDKLIGVLLAYTHLLGHLGTGKMLKNLQSYYFRKMYTQVRSFTSKCYSCFLMHGSSRKAKVGTYPLPDFPMEEISLDLIENLNKSGGFQNILVAKDALTDFVLLFPLKGKTAGEVNRACKYGIFQQYNVKRLHTDNGPCFRQGEFLGLLAELKIEVLNTSVHKPTARGFIEKEVHIIKTIFKKILATSSSKSLNWENLPLLVSTILNHTVSTRTGFKPAVMLYGEGNMSKCFLDSEQMVPVHHSIRNNRAQLYKISDEIQSITEIARETIKSKREKEHENLNENRIEKKFKKDDIVFVYDRSYVQGAPRPLRTKFSPSPHVIVKVFYTTVLIQRLADNFRTLISMDDIKLYKGTDPEFNDLPPRIKKILIHDFKDLMTHDYDDILRIDPLEIPRGIELGNNDRDSEEEDSDIEDPGEGPSGLCLKEISSETHQKRDKKEGESERNNDQNERENNTCNKGSGRRGKRRKKNKKKRRPPENMAEINPSEERLDKDEEKPGTSTESTQVKENTNTENTERKPEGTKKKSLEENWNLQDSDTSTDEDEKEMLLRSGRRVRFK